MSTRLSFGYISRDDRYLPEGDTTFVDTKSNYFTVGLTEEFRPKIYNDGSFKTTIGYNLTQSTGDVQYMKHYYFVRCS